MHWRFWNEVETLNRSNNTLYYIKVVGLSDSMRSMIRREWGWIYVLWRWFWILRRYTTILSLPVIGIGLERARRRAYIYICESACVDDSRYYRISYRYICTNKQRCCMRDILREGRTRCALTRYVLLVDNCRAMAALLWCWFLCRRTMKRRRYKATNNMREKDKIYHTMFKIL